MKLYLFSFRIFLCSFIISLAPATIKAQLFSEKKYPQNYFQWPVGAKIGLAANFGELRPNHYHMGLDCKTDQKQNVPVYSAADGYIAKVKIEPSGFGRALYINHPNGLTTLYAHLNEFYPELEKYVTEQQYQLEQWNVFLDIPSDLFPLKKGDFIANSGNTGGSQGPHLHFEIRDTKTDKVLNPLLFGFPIEDNIAPDIIRLAIYDRRYSTYEQTPKIYPLKKTNGIYAPIGGKIKLATDKVSFAITAYDRYTGSTNQNGIYKAELFLKGWPIAGFEMDSISYDETRYLNAHIDYKTRSGGGAFLQHLSKLPGYTNGIYKTSPWEDGVVNLADTIAIPIKINVSDANNNVSVLEFLLIRDSAISERVNKEDGPVFKPGMMNIFEKNTINFYLPEKSLYDSFHFVYSEIITSKSAIYRLHNTSVPVQNYFPVKIKAGFPLHDTGHIVMNRFSGNKTDFKKAVYENGWYKASFREFGNYQLLIDSIPPVITPLGFKNGMNTAKLKRIAFSVTDNSEDIGSFRATLDGKWLRFSNDKGRVFIYNFDEHCSPGEHELKIVVTDKVGNVSEKVYTFKR